jgi:hypothetical protein
MVANSSQKRRTRQAERRRFGRFTTRLPVTTLRDDLVARGQDVGAAKCRLEVRDFSLGGVLADCPVRLKVDEQLTLRLPPHDRRPPVEMTGRVKHCRRQDDTYRVGIEFCETPARASGSPWPQMPRLFSLAFRSGDGDG